ncbi:ATP-dependent zinc protease family protein, partial [Vibrio parahaemolyticus V-223/04]
RKTCEGAKNT